MAAPRQPTRCDRHRDANPAEQASLAQPEARSALARRVLAPGKDGFTVRKLMSPLALADELGLAR